MMHIFYYYMRSKKSFLDFHLSNYFHLIFLLAASLTVSFPLQLSPPLPLKLPNPIIFPASI